MKSKGVYIAFILLVIAIIFSYFKTNYYIQKNINNNKNIVRYGNDVSVGDIIYINGNKEEVVKILNDGSYITKIVK
ncbi:MAG: hypothetical protein ACLUCH_07865 [Lachnospirales bacterium]|nr:hypothetical protein [Clostridiales bacterium]